MMKSIVAKVKVRLVCLPLIVSVRLDLGSEWRRFTWHTYLVTAVAYHVFFPLQTPTPMAGSSSYVPPAD